MSVEHSNLNKLVIGFLALAIITSTSVLIFSGNYFNGPGPAASEGATQKKGAVKVPANAFVESLAGTGRPSSTPSVTSDGLPAVTPTGNLTETLAQHLAQEMVAENPLGPQTTDQGLSLVLPEEPEAILEKLAAANPDLEKEIQREALVVIAEKDVKVVSNYTVPDFQAYAAAIQSIASGNLSQAQIEAIIRDLPPAEALSTLEVLLESAIIQAKKVSVPAPLTDLHKNFLRILEYQRKALALASSQDDPLRASLILEENIENYELAASQFNNELEKANSLLQDISGVYPADESLNFLENLFSVKKANAFAIFGVQISFDPAVFGRMVWNFTRSVLLETLKDRIIHQLVNQVIRWINGSGTPQFVTNWRAFLDDAANKAAGDVIYKVAPQLCSSFGPLIRLSFTVTPPLEQPVVCTLDQVVSNVRNFYNDFNQGGWIAYSTMLQPQNNFLGAFIITSDIVALESAKAREEAKNKALASGGFTPQQQCAKSEFRNKWQQCVLERGGEAQCRGIPNVTEAVCTEYQVTTPGSVTQQITTAALNSPISRIVNAQDIAALTSAFVNAALNRLTSAAIGGLRALTGGGSIAGAATPTAQQFSNLCQALDQSTIAVRRFHDFAEANRGQLESGEGSKTGSGNIAGGVVGGVVGGPVGAVLGGGFFGGGSGENFKVKADSVVWYNRAIDVNSPVAGLQSTISGFRDPVWDPVEIQIGRFTNWLEEVITSLVKDEDLDFEGEWNRNDPPTQGVQGVIRMTENFGNYLNDLEQVIGDCTNPDTSRLGQISDPDIGVPNDGGEEEGEEEEPSSGEACASEEEIAQFLIDNPGDEGRLAEAFPCN